MRTLFFAIACIAAAVAANAEEASDSGPMPLGQTVYLGLGGLYNSANTADRYNLASSGVGLSIIGGWRIFPYLGLEAAYEQAGTSKAAGVGFKNASTIRTLAGDLYGYWPVGRKGWFQPFVTVGLGATGLKARQIHSYETPVVDANGAPVLNTDGTPKMDGHRDVSPIASPSSTHFRVGGGVEWTMGTHFAGRITGRYQPYQLGEVIDHGASVSLALLVRI